MKRIMIFAVIAMLLIPIAAFAGGGNQASSGSGEIHIGSVVCSEGAFAAVGVPYGNMMRAYVDYINQAPEYRALLNGRQLRLTMYDDRGDGAAGKTYIERLIHDDRVFAMVGILGTWNVEAARNELETAGIPSVYYGTGSSAQLFEPAVGDQRYMMGVQPLYKTEGRLLYLRASTHFQNVRSIGVVYSTSDDGMSLMEGIRTQHELDTRANKPTIVYQAISSSDAASITSQIAAVQNCDVIIAAGNQIYFRAVYSAAYANSIARPKPVVTSYVNAAPTNMPAEAVNPGAAEIYTSAWVVPDELGTESAEAARRQADYAEFVRIIDWDTRYIPASEKEAYKVNGFAMSGYIAVKTFLVGIERLNASGRPLTAQNYLEAMESARIPIAIAGSVNYARGNRIGIDSMSFLKYEPPASGPAENGALVTVDPVQNIDELIARLSR